MKLKIKHSSAGHTAKHYQKLAAHYHTIIGELVAREKLKVSELYLAIRNKFGAPATSGLTYEDLEACLWLLNYTGSETEPVCKKPPHKGKATKGD